MPNYNFGMGFQSNPMDAYGEMAGIVRRSRLSKLLGDYYSTGQADIGQLAQLDPETAASVRQEQQKASLGKMLGEAYTADEGKRKQILAQVFALDPNAATSVDRAARERSKSDMQRLYALSVGNDKSAFNNAYSQYRQGDGAWLPENADPAVIAELAGQSESYRPHVVGGALVDSTGKVLYQAQEKPKYTIKEVGGRLYYLPESPVAAPSANTPTQNAGFDILSEAVKWQESRGNPNAVSPKGAVGTMQTMPGTLRDPGYGVDPARDNSPQELERVGVDYLRAMTEKYGTVGGLAAYNWGPGNWEKALAAAGGDPERALAMAPAETQKYVPSVLQRVQGGAGMGFGTQAMQVPAGAIPVPGVPDSPGKFQSRQLTPDEVANIGLPPGTIAYTTESGKPDIVSRPDARTGSGGEQPLSAGERAKIRGEMKDTKDALGMFKAFDDALNSIGKIGSVFNGADRGRLGTAYNNARSALRVLYNTGVLQPGELPMLNQALQDPNSIGALLDPRSRSQIQAQLDELYRTVARQIENKVRSYPQLYDNAAYDRVVNGQSGRSGKYRVGQVIEANGKRYRVTGGDMNDPDVEEVR